MVRTSTTMSRQILLPHTRCLDWVLDKLAKLQTKTPSKDLLNIYQAPACYHACIAVKEAGESFGDDLRKSKAAEAYETIYSRDLLEFFRDECGHKLPWWLESMMGKSNMVDRGE